MPNVISQDKRSVTFLENRLVFDWMESMARARNTDVSVILREASSAYYNEHREAKTENAFLTMRAGEKAAKRAVTAHLIETGELTPDEAQERNAPIRGPVTIVDLWPSIRRRARAKYRGSR
jgi:hypothetical protein